MNVNKVKKIVTPALVVIGLIVVNGFYWIFSDVQTKCVEKIAKGEPISYYDKFSISTLHLGMCTIGSLYCSEAAWANFKMLTTDQDTVYLHSNKWLTPKVKARFANQQLGRMAWNGDSDYALKSPEKDGAILLNWCMLDERVIDGKECYVAECDYTWKVPSKTTFKITKKFSIVVYEQLFYELEKTRVLHPFKLVCYFEKKT